MDGGDFFLGPGEGVDRRQGLLAQLLGVLDQPAGVRHTGRQSPFAFCRGPVDLGLLPLAARFVPLEPGSLAGEALRVKSQPRDGLQRALLQSFDTQAERSPALIEFLLPFLGLALALVSQGFAFVGQALALASSGLAFVRRTPAFIGRGLALVGSPAALPRGWPFTVHTCKDPPVAAGAPARRR
jgi:hypothetical protein